MKKRKSQQKKRKQIRDGIRTNIPYKLSEDNPAQMSWKQIFNRFNGGSNETMFGIIV